MLSKRNCKKRKSPESHSQSDKIRARGAAGVRKSQTGSQPTAICRKREPEKKGNRRAGDTMCDREEGRGEGTLVKQNKTPKASQPSPLTHKFQTKSAATTRASQFRQALGDHAFILRVFTTTGATPHGPRPLKPGGRPRPKPRRDPLDPKIPKSRISLELRAVHRPPHRSRRRSVWREQRGDHTSHTHKPQRRRAEDIMRRRRWLCSAQRGLFFF